MATGKVLGEAGALRVGKDHVLQWSLQIQGERAELPGQQEEPCQGQYHLFPYQL